MIHNIILKSQESLTDEELEALSDNPLVRAMEGYCNDNFAVILDKKDGYVHMELNYKYSKSFCVIETKSGKYSYSRTIKSFEELRKKIMLSILN